MSGYSLPELLSMRIADLEAAETPAEIAAHLQRLVLQTEERFETRHRRKDGAIFDVEVSAQYRSYGGGQFVFFLNEITERKQAEERIKASLAEKEVLLKEIHHRVKNNLQVISSLLELQAHALEDERIHLAFQNSQARIRAMAGVHEQLYQASDLARVNMEVYLENLTRDLRRAYEVRNVTIWVEAGEARLGIDQAIPCGLIINELVSNALKYAFVDFGSTPELRLPEIRISLQAEAGRWLLTVSDNGRGLPEALTVEAAQSLGLRLVSMLTQQLRGTLTLGGAEEPGAIFKIWFARSENR